MTLIHTLVLGSLYVHVTDKKHCLYAYRVQFMYEFKPYPKVDPQPQPSTVTNKKKRPSARPELHHGEPFRPLYVYEMLTKISSSLSTKVHFTVV